MAPLAPVLALVRQAVGAVTDVVAEGAAAPEVIREVVELDTAGQLPTSLYAIVQSGVFNDGKQHTHVELTHRKDRLDQGVVTATKYGDPKIKYKAVYGVVTWLEEEVIVPDAATKQLTLLPEGPVPRKNGGTKK